MSFCELATFFPPESYLRTFAVLLILLGSSAGALILIKWREYRRDADANARFHKLFYEAPSFEAALAATQFCGGSCPRILNSAIRASDAQHSTTNETPVVEAAGGRALLSAVRFQFQREAERKAKGLTLLAGLAALAAFVSALAAALPLFGIDCPLDQDSGLATASFPVVSAPLVSTMALGLAIGVMTLAAHGVLYRTARTRVREFHSFSEDLLRFVPHEDLRRALHAVNTTAQRESSKTEQADKDSYGQILKSSALIGGSSMVNIAIGIVRTKVMALLLGPGGVGLMGMYGSIADLAVNVASMGINSSGVRQIAEAEGSGDADRIARTVTVLRRTAVILGMLGGGLLIQFAGQVSAVTFGDTRYSSAVVLLSVAVFFRCVSAGQGALIQGMRRISDLAKMGILSSAIGTLVSIPLIYVLREDGVVPSLIAIAAVGVLTSWWYSRKIRVTASAMRFPNIVQEASALLKLGFAFMASGIMMMGAAYAIRVLVLRVAGFEAAGLYQSAWALGGLYVGFILDAMGTDFYPRLTAVAQDNAACNRLVNEQAHVSMLLAGPGIIATISLAPLVIALFYSTKFFAAVEVLRWLCLGMALRIISWPMGFIVLAKGAQQFFFWSELAWTVVYLCLAWVCINEFGLNGAGMAFFGAYAFHLLMVVVIARRLSGYRWSKETLTVCLFFVATLAIAHAGNYLLPALPAMILGTIVAGLSGVYSARTLLTLVPHDRIPRKIFRFLVWLRLANVSSAAARA